MGKNNKVKTLIAYFDKIYANQNSHTVRQILFYLNRFYFEKSITRQIYNAPKKILLCRTWEIYGYQYSISFVFVTLPLASRYQLQYIVTDRY